MEEEINIYDQIWRLHSSKAAFLPQHQVLLVSDIHIGKLSHFRKAGIPLPDQGEEQNLKKLSYLIHYYKPSSVFLLGDVFHSEKSQIWHLFKDFLNANATIRFCIILGNHDRYIRDFFDDCDNITLTERTVLGNLILTHEPLLAELYDDEQVNICGHVHPAVLLHGKGKQKIKLPCFYFSKRQAIMPAFGVFTGTHVLSTTKSDRVYVCYENLIAAI